MASLTIGSTADAITGLSGLGYVNGYPDGSFGPQGDATRAEACAMAKNFLDLRG